MGGLGSGSNWHGWRRRKKTTVEDCDALDANCWMREGILKAGAHQRGSWRLNCRDGREESIDYEVDTRDRSSLSVRLTYWSIPIDPDKKETIDYRVRLATTVPRFGGLHWWFLCPLLVHGRPCNRRVGKLYMPPGGRYFGCRHCHKLNYASSQDSHMERRHIRKLARDMGVDVGSTRHDLWRRLLRLERTLCGPRLASRQPS